MNILQTLPSLISGGVERGTVEIANYLVKHKHNALVASNGGELVKLITNNGGRHIKLPLQSKNPLTIYLNHFKLLKVIKENQIDLIHARSRAPAWSSYLAARSAGIPFITTFHGIYKITGKLKHSYNQIMTKGDKVIAISNFVANHIKENYQIDESKIHVIHRGVDPEIFCPNKITDEHIALIAQKFNIPLDRHILLLPGRITRWKGHEFLLEALSLLPKDSFYCLFAGDDKGHIKYRKSLEKKIHSIGLAQNVAIIKHQSNMQVLYKLANIVFSTSLEPEAFGRIAIEAQAMAKIVIATNIGGSCETIIDNKTGFLITPNDVSALANKISEVLSLSLAEKNQIGLDARAHIIENFSLETMCKKTMELYESVCLYNSKK